MIRNAGTQTGDFDKPVPGGCMTLRSIWQILRVAMLQFMADGVPRMGAALAFYATLSFAPLAVILIALVALVFGQSVAEGRILSELEVTVGPEASHALQTMITAAELKSSGPIRYLVGWMALLIAAFGFFFELQDSINRVWKCEVDSSRSWWKILRRRMVSFVIVGITALLLITSLLVSTMISAMTAVHWGAGGIVLIHLMQPFISWAIAVGLFATIFWLLPDATIAWNEVWFGAIVTASLFVAGKALIAIYLSSSAVTSFYGAASSFAVLMLWNYYTAQIFLFGVELTKANANYSRAR
ncbi:YihY/virulence factor BrkB family protein [Schlesneria paludicola]|uniref:YihY/virulence factor BrkB family protein n=1 Tax=Schlesneria paludicola TaxID=360056 RepID=UPI0007C4C6C3|nr:YihY/virulence factor BrkB family protein [Schlesneria paludicola]